MEEKSSDNNNDNVTGNSSKMEDTTLDSSYDNNEIMLKACSDGDLEFVKRLIHNNSTSTSSSMDEKEGTVVTRQDSKSGMSPLMEAAKHGHTTICEVLLENGAPWNAIDRNGKCAGNYATEYGYWDIVNLLVDAGTKAELILGATIRHTMKQQPSNNTTTIGKEDGVIVPVEHEPCTKLDYLEQTNVRYNPTKTALLDNDDDAIMMEWERPLMKAHASILTNQTKGTKRILNVGFGMGIIDTILQTEWEPSYHVIIEAHPKVYEQMKVDGWDQKKGVRICYGRWQDWMPKLIQEEGLQFDGIFYDTYGEHFTDLEDFQQLMSQILQKPNGIYSFFNGLAPDNLFFHGVGTYTHPVKELFFL